MNTKHKLVKGIVAIATILWSTFLSTNTFAQSAESGSLALEEIIVTAQRREQSLQEVPISMEAFNGFELLQQGFRTMDDLAEFSPTVEIDNRVQDQDISIRGVGTVGNSLTLEQGAPTFVDGIVFGRTSMVKGAFMDLERIEILRGPQPVFFGQNATAGAFSLITRGPTADWQGNVSAEVGNFGRTTLEGGIGGPVTDTLGIRVAGKYDNLDGFLTDVISGEKFPEREDKAGRITLQWAPTDAFRSTVKLGMSDYFIGGESIGVCLGANADTWTPDDRDGGVAIGIDALVPGRTSFDDILDIRDIPQCGGGTKPFERIGIKAPDEYFAFPADVAQEDAREGAIDGREVVRRIRRETYGRDLSGFDEAATTIFSMELNYAFANGVEISSLSGYVDYDRTYNRNNSNSPFLGNMRQRSEDLQQASQELRVSSEVGGSVEWMLGAYWQDNDLDLISDNFRGNLRRSRRLNIAWEDSKWVSAFATLTFNFMDDKASIDLGARYTDVEKEGYIKGLGAQWVFTEPADPNFRDIDDVIPAVTAEGVQGFTMPWRSRRIPSNWNSPATPAGMTALSGTIRRTPGPYQDKYNDSGFDPAITFRYRPNEDVSLYAKWATAFKAGGFDTGVGSLPDTPEEFLFEPENAEIFEIGAKGVFWNGRARADVSLFHMEVDDLQLATNAPDLSGVGFSQGSVSTNAGLQRVKGLEFSIDAALTENLRGRIAAALMDGEMVEFVGAGCTAIELDNAETGPCFTEEESIAYVEENGLLVDPDFFEGTIDRSGADAPRTPDYKIAIKLDYARPLMDGYLGFAGMNVSFSDGYITNVEDFDLVQKAGKHTDLNLNIGIGDENGRWRVSAWARNLFEVQEEYNAELDIEGDGIITDSLSPSNFTTYGLQFEYNYN
jgi:outer membrane receptor protein involved in Fe transport